MSIRKTIVFLLLCTIILVFFNTPKLRAVDTTTVKYFPLSVGNIWVYDWANTIYPYFSAYGTTRIKIVNTCFIDGKMFYGSQYTTSNQSPTSCGVGIIDTIRVDSITGNIYQYYGTVCLFDSLKARIYDTCKNLCQSSPMVCTDTSSVNLFGQLRPSKKFIGGEFEQFYERQYVQNIGIVLDGANWNMVSCIFTLKGCVINGVVMGDTTFPVGIIPISNEIPKAFSLSQNYPNPFNPKTMIKFSLPFPSKGGVSLVIYDVVGRKVASLIPPLWGGQEGLQPGTYEIEFDGTNYPSGVYFYKLTAGDYTETKKMVLIK